MKLPKLEVIKKGAVWKNHFDENLDFKFIDKDSMTLGTQVWQLWHRLWHRHLRVVDAVQMQRDFFGIIWHPRTGEEITRALTPAALTRCDTATLRRVTTGPAWHNQAYNII